jgi:GNAT superfamily N-acetyltransferase
LPIALSDATCGTFELAAPAHRSIYCQVEPFSDALTDIVPLIDEHWREVGSFTDRFARRIHFEDYRQLERQSRLLTVTARDQGCLVGYFVGALGLDLHRVTLEEPHRRVPMLSALVYYLQPSHRGHARSLIGAIEREAAARAEVRIVNIRVKPGMNGAADFLAALGYTPVEVTFTKVLKESEHANARSTVA